ncbi:hypothetical protein ISF_08384 [Cordyceps fumosorosea ARSEF 2679]|uniref:Uncharacterized protein n=1 Tax=Cordyceps fumosorosea (strain ARSEF 2679) TaxID=1081104 RepID=A0A167MK48_CORFA|nr:hypothetical protein ISF_08384 [Cordyceps fumosorosea ARSEF 2679]OAA54456.1 hypothetical protein ISF_08384 [Cordyceps fumosorosea ARSEF 2679]
MSSSQNQFLILSPEIRSATVPAATAPRFLSLAPDVSDSHPRAQRTRADSDASSSTASASSPTLSAVDAAVPVANTRVLKLSPVHWGAHVEDHQADYHDLVQSE